MSILVLTLILGTLLVGSILFFSIRAQHEYFMENARTEMQALANAVGSNPEPSAIKDILTNAARSSRVRYLEFGRVGRAAQVAQGRQRTFLRDTRYGQHGDHLYFLSEPIRSDNGKLIGTLKCGFDERRLDSQISHIVNRSLVFSLVYMWALMLITASLAMRLTNPIKRLQMACRDIASGEIDKKLTVESDISEISDLGADLELMRRELVAHNKQIAAILDNAAEGIFTFDQQGAIQSFNRSAESLFGYTADEVVGRDLTLLIPPQDALAHRKGYLDDFLKTKVSQFIGHEGEVVGVHKDGASFHMALKVSIVAFDERQMYTALVADISDRKALMEHLKAMAEHDGLTGLFNRSYFQDSLEQLVELTRRSKQPSALLYIDLDHFKYVNDTLGHGAGDRLLIEISSILVKLARKSDLIARLGGDEFTILLYNVPVGKVHGTAELFRKGLADYPFRQGGEQVDIGCSIGVGMITEKTQSAAEVLSRADIACHLAKRKGRNRVHIFNPEDEADVTAMSVDMGWSRRIKDAIEGGRFALACQPIVSTLSGMIESYEVLIRMLDERGELIMPGSFLPSAERFGLAKEIDKWVIVNAIETLSEQRTHSRELRFSLNLSGQTLSDPGVCDLIHQVLRRANLDPAALTFEVTETVAIADMSVAATFLSKLRQIGCKTALDDFGSGMSSFAYLKDLPVDCVKIDGRFVRNMATNSVDEAMVKAMNEIAHALGKQTIAEFVEDGVTLRLLGAHGIDYVQGYHVGRPNVVTPYKADSDQPGIPSLCLIDK